MLSLSAYSEVDENDAVMIRIEVRDNGNGFLVNLPEGNGLLNMSHRAKKIDADLNVTSDELGTCVTIILPVN
jgi:signal transduction histidine kinase